MVSNCSGSDIVGGTFCANAKTPKQKINSNKIYLTNMTRRQL